MYFKLENGFYIVHFLLGLRVVSIFFLFIGDYWLILSNGKHWWTSLVDALLCDFCTEHKQPAILFCDNEAHFTLFLISCFTNRPNTSRLTTILFMRRYKQVVSKQCMYLLNIKLQIFLQRLTYQHNLNFFSTRWEFIIFILHLEGGSIIVGYFCIKFWL